MSSQSSSTPSPQATFLRPLTECRAPAGAVGPVFISSERATTGSSWWESGGRGARGVGRGARGARTQPAPRTQGASLTRRPGAASGAGRLGAGLEAAPDELPVGSGRLLPHGRTAELAERADWAQQPQEHEFGRFFLPGAPGL